MKAFLRKLALSILDFIRHQKSYSQDGEDVTLAAFFQDRKHYKGYFVDIGAHHPVRFSNTWMFYKKGWKGINIDPTPGSMKSFNWLRRRDINLEIGIGSEAGNMTFFCFNEPALNTFDKEVARQRDTGKPYRIIKKEVVPILPLSQVLEKHLLPNQIIDFFTIDVEGLDLAVLQSNDWKQFSPSYILVEDTAFSVGEFNDSEIYQFLRSKGYKICAVLKRTIIYKRI